MDPRSYWARIAAQRLRRRRILALAGMGAASLLAACGGSTKKQATGSNSGSGAGAGQQAAASTSSSAATATPQRGGTLNLVSPSQFGNLHPQEAGGSGYTRQYVYDHLVNSDYVHGTLDFSAAMSLEHPSPLQYIFKIRPDSKFQPLAPVNGRPVTSADVVASWKNFVADPKGIGAKTALSPLLSGLQTPDDATLVINQPQPNIWTLGPHGLAAPIPTAILPKELLGGDALQKQALGSSGYLLDQFDPASGISFKRRPDGWHGDRPYINAVSVKVVTDPTAQAAALRAKQIDTLVARDKLQADEFQGYGKDMVIDKLLNFPRLLWMRADMPPFNDQRLRAAVYAGLDIQGLIDKVEVGQGEWSGPVPPYLTTWSLSKAELKQTYPFDLKKAKGLLSAAAWDSSKQLEMKFPQNPKAQTLAEIVQQQLAAIGFKTTLVPQDPVTVFGAQTVAQRSFVLLCTDQYFLGQDPDIWLRYYGLAMGIGQGQPAAWASTPEIEALITQQATMSDQAQQKATILDAQRKLLAAFEPAINLYSPYQFTGRWSYYHPDANRGYAGLLGLYDWLQKKS